MMKKIIIIFSIIILPLIIFGGFYWANQSKIITPIINDKEIVSDYYVDKGLEDIAKIVAPAIENYASQDSTESASTRNSRLSLYFSGDSPVFDYDLLNIVLPVNKSTAKVLSIKSSESEGEELNLEVNVSLTLYANNETSTKNQKYWVSLIKIFDGSMMPYDLGEME